MNRKEKIAGFAFIGFVLGIYTFLYVATSQNGHTPVFRHFSSDRYHLDTVAPDWAEDTTMDQKKINHLNELLSR